MPAPNGRTDPIVGIDLGTTYSLVAWCDPKRGGGPRILPDDLERALLPSVVRYDESGRPAAIGLAAREAPGEHAAWTVRSVKRLMGRSLRDAAPDLPYLSYEVVEGEAHTARVRLPSGKVLSPQEVSAVILRALKERASRALGAEVRRAVVTVPAYFDDAQRQATRDAGRLAGLEVVRIVNEPTAAALAYGIGLTARRAETIAVYDLGGGTFDISILRVTPADDATGGADFFQVVSTAGDTHLGGDDIDQALAALAAGESMGRLRPSDRSVLLAAAEAAKARLSEVASATIEASIDGHRLQRTVKREELESLAAPLVERTIAACARALRDADLAPDQVDRVVMVGGATRMPLVRRRVGEFFGREPYTALNPDEVVALGAAVQGSIMAGTKRDALLLDVIPLSLGIETMGGAVAKLILRNSTLPARATEMFSTSADGQTSIKVHILQGEREMAPDCRSLGLFHLRGIPPMPAGIPQMEVEFLVDASGVLNVSAVERRSGTRAGLQIVPNHGLTREEVERMEAESIAHAREDMTRHRVVDLCVAARMDAKWIDERLRVLAGELEPSYRRAVQEALDRLRGLISEAERDWRGVDADSLHQAKEDLDRVSMRLHEISMVKTLRGEGT